MKVLKKYDYELDFVVVFGEILWEIFEELGML